MGSFEELEYWTDGGCTGFPDGIPWLGWNWQDCCIAHDFNAGDAYLYQCIIENSTIWIAPIVLICIGLMILARPFYQMWLRSQGHKV